MRTLLFISFLVFFLYPPIYAQEILNKTLLKADKLYINRNYTDAVNYYIRYLGEFPRDYYASRQTAVCYDRLNDPNNAIDYWPVVVESSEATESDYLAYGKSLLANNRVTEAKKVFLFLSRSLNQDVAAWGRTYLNPAFTGEEIPGVTVTELANTNSGQSEYCPVFFKDKLFYVLDQQNDFKNFRALNNSPLQNIRLCIPRDSLNFVPSLLYEKIQALNLQGQFCFSPDGNWLCFSKALSNKELFIKSKTPFYKLQLFLLKMSTLHNAVPEIIAFEHNQPDYNFIHPCFSADGKELYFASDRKGSLGGMDIFICERKENGWSEPKNAGPEINSSGNEVYPQISVENVLYFSSDQRPGRGGLDLFYAKRALQSEALFEAAVNCGAPINSRFDDFGICLLKGGNRGYLSSNRKENSNSDLYFFTGLR